MPGQIYVERNKPGHPLMKLFEGFIKGKLYVSKPEPEKGGRKQEKMHQEKKYLETDISTRLNAPDAFKDKDCDPGFLYAFKWSLTSKGKKIWYRFRQYTFPVK